MQKIKFRKQSNWAKQELKQLFEVEGDALDIIAIHEAAIELSLESPLAVLKELRAKIIKKKVKAVENNRLPNLEIKPQSTKGYIYVVKSSDAKYKIGRTRDPLHRVDILQTGSHKKLRLILKVKTSNCNVLENICHRKFSDKRIRGEWFNLADEDLTWLRNLPKI